MNTRRFFSIGILYVVVVFTPAPVYFLSVALYGIYFRSLVAPLLIALLIDVQFAAINGLIPWYLIGTALSLMVVCVVRPYVRFVPQS